MKIPGRNLGLPKLGAQISKDCKVNWAVVLEQCLLRLPFLKQDIDQHHALHCTC